MLGHKILADNGLTVRITAVSRRRGSFVEPAGQPRVGAWGGTERKKRMEEFDYFMIRVRKLAPGALDGALSGVAERLATGEKWSFGSGEELLRVVGGEVEFLKNMSIPAHPGKHLEAAVPAPGAGMPAPST
jgi:hypothetical protein